MKIIYLFLFAITLSMCNKTTNANNNTTDQPPESLSGKWIWQQTSFQTRGMPVPKVTNPETEGVNMVIDFLSETQLKVLHNDVVVQTLSYTITGSEKGQKFIRVEGIDNNISPNIQDDGPLRINGDQLEIIGGYNDAGANQLFVKMK